ncbi:predicted protein [Plenodomus lingam JN3]|uniref:Predicted protein n=1 Tax=Leptosphaeria maculans (strain JN3 / isolate v23.1.3 / race Av1-4-5-6-7-8) TaxID=985895 RepID=E4ZUE6_LEPMJ|nr:predicted protein [Plenodomus lingam JN3]CBX95025.1 predicted protein [Plenodomus lingam JN3]
MPPPNSPPLPHPSAKTAQPHPPIHIHSLQNTHQLTNSSYKQSQYHHNVLSHHYTLSPFSLFSNRCPNNLVTQPDSSPPTPCSGTPRSPARYHVAARATGVTSFVIGPFSTAIEAGEWGVVRTKVEVWT